MGRPSRRRTPVKWSVVMLLLVLGLSPVLVANAATGPLGTPSPSATPGEKPPSPPYKIGIPTDSTASQAIQDICLSKYPTICAGFYAGEELDPDAPLVIYLGPGDDTAFMNALHALMSSSAFQAFGPEPTITITRVPQSIATLNEAAVAYNAAIPQLLADGFVPSTSEPNIQEGTYDVAFVSAPNGMTTDVATADLQQSVSPLIRSISVNASAVTDFSGGGNRGHDIMPYYAGDLVVNSSTGTFCTAGFNVIGTLGQPRGTTDAHCNNYLDKNNNWQTSSTGTFTNGGWTIQGTDPGVPTSDGTTPSLYGSTSSNWQFSGDADIQFLDNPLHGFNPFVWFGVGMAAPVDLAVGNPYSTYPASPTLLTTDGAFSRSVRYVRVTASGQGVCYFDGDVKINICGLIQLNETSETGQYPAAQPGDSGGPVFCYACVPNAVTPAGMIKAGILNRDGSMYATFIGNDMDATGGHIWVTP